MTKENKLKIALALNGIAVSLDNESFNKVKERLETIERIIKEEPEDKEC